MNTLTKADAEQALLLKFPNILLDHWTHECWEGAHCWANTYPTKGYLAAIRVADLGDGNPPDVTMGTTTLYEGRETEEERLVRLRWTDELSDELESIPRTG